MADKYQYDWRQDKSLFQAPVTTSDSAHWYDVAPNLTDTAKEISTEHRLADMMGQEREQQTRLQADEALLKKFELEKQVRERRIDHIQTEIDTEIRSFNEKSDKDVEEWIKSRYVEADAAASRYASKTESQGMREKENAKIAESSSSEVVNAPSAPPSYSEIEFESLVAKSHYPVEFQSHKSIEGQYAASIRLRPLNPDADNLCWKCYSQIEDKAACEDAEGNILHQDCYFDIKFPKCDWCFYKISPAEDKPSLFRPSDYTIMYNAELLNKIIKKAMITFHQDRKFRDFGANSKVKDIIENAMRNIQVQGRCTVCFDVIITRPTQDFCGKFIQNNDKLALRVDIIAVESKI
ncbi:uncharacterized protein TRIADDRAFT_59544 [Trichoplax adhaerens]|uniref:Uncharacterized protein n=1 Tax=Trichoplax adhaerens TaxID=10228 RepID=B3S5X8_TRIAD|nr:predicted protein [Trichoplax adhaerens]EDV21888.1 predicted protein [Trichoplax adhaerens]|eukprot:XP_002115525.1 predicted protein [Trichoplax adhaerens]